MSFVILFEYFLFVVTIWNVSSLRWSKPDSRIVLPSESCKELQHHHFATFWRKALQDFERNLWNHCYRPSVHSSKRQHCLLQTSPRLLQCWFLASQNVAQYSYFRKREKKGSKKVSYLWNVCEKNKTRYQQHWYVDCVLSIRTADINWCYLVSTGTATFSMHMNVN